MGITLKKAKPIQQQTDGLTGFAGLNRNLRRNEYEFADMRNMQSSHLPVMATRQRRRLIRTLAKPNGLFAHDALCWVDGTGFYVGGVLKGQVEDSRKTFVRMGGKLIIMPDKLIYDSAADALTAMEHTVTTTETVTCTLCRADGTTYENYTISATAPESPTAGQLWMDTSGETAALRMYDANNAMWSPVPTVYTMIASSGIGVGFAEYDGVTISGMSNEDLNGSFYLVSRSDNAIVVTALITTAATQTTAVTVSRTMPDMDYLCECNNRLWGCAADGHELYACALGDPTNWNQFLGLSTDSYAVNVGSGGRFTGVAAHLGNVYFFKADAIHQVMGTSPKNYSTSVMQAQGVGEGNSLSLCRANETLYYKASDRVCAFGSSLPTPVSDALPGLGGNAVAGVLGDQYTLCVDRGSGREVLCYDAKFGAWMKEDDADIGWFAAYEGALYRLATDGALWCSNADANALDGEGAQTEPPVSWMLETADIGLDAPYNKYMSGIQLYGDTDMNATLRVLVEYDHSGQWVDVMHTAPRMRQSLVIPIRPKRCRTLRLRLEGEGGFRLYSITKRTEEGSDKYAFR